MAMFRPTRRSAPILCLTFAAFAPACARIENAADTRAGDDTAAVVESPPAATDQPRYFPPIKHLRWVAGVKLNCRSAISHDSTVSRPGAADETSRRHVIVDLELDVQSVNAAGVATVKATYRALQCMQAQGSRLLAFDSRKVDPIGELLKTQSETTPIFKIYAALPGRSFTLTIRPTGEVTSIAGIDDLRAQVIAATGMGDAGSAIASELLDADTLRASWNGAMHALPEAEGERRDGWTISNTSDLPGVGGLTHRRDFTLASLPRKADKTLIDLRCKHTMTFEPVKTFAAPDRTYQIEGRGFGAALCMPDDGPDIVSTFNTFHDLKAIDKSGKTLFTQHAKSRTLFAVQLGEFEAMPQFLAEKSLLDNQRGTPAPEQPAPAPAAP